jgi:CTP-dependent riboflavin kinase
MKPLRLTGRVQAGKGDASRWLSMFNDAYSRKLGGPVFPGSLNLALDADFDWFAPDLAKRTLWFDRSEYGGERDILLVRCVLENLANEPAWLWTPTTAARDRPDPWVIEIVAFRSLRSAFALEDGSVVEIMIPDL